MPISYFGFEAQLVGKSECRMSIFIDQTEGTAGDKFCSLMIDRYITLYMFVFEEKFLIVLLRHHAFVCRQTAQVSYLVALTASL